MIDKLRYNHILVLNIDKDEKLLSTDRLKIDEITPDSLKTTLDDPRIYYTKLLKVFVPDARTEDTRSPDTVQRELPNTGTSPI